MEIKYDLSTTDDPAIVILLDRLNKGTISVQDAASCIGTSATKFIDLYSVKDNKVESVEPSCTICIHNNEGSCSIKCKRKNTSMQDSFQYDYAGWFR